MIEPTNKNGYQGQKCGPFLLGENVALEILNTEAIEKNLTIKHLGIQAPAGTVVTINEKNFIIDDFRPCIWYYGKCTVQS
jgi:hypothetical protein